MSLPNMITVTIKQTSLKFVYDDGLYDLLKDLGEAVTDRASHVDPDPNNPGKWLADMSPLVGKPLVLGPFDSRGEALTAEIRFIEENIPYYGW